MGHSFFEAKNVVNTFFSKREMPWLTIEVITGVNIFNENGQLKTEAALREYDYFQKCHWVGHLTMWNYRLMKRLMVLKIGTDVAGPGPEHLLMWFKYFHPQCTHVVITSMLSFEDWFDGWSNVDSGLKEQIRRSVSKFIDLNCKGEPDKIAQANEVLDRVII